MPHRARRDVDANRSDRGAVGLRAAATLHGGFRSGRAGYRSVTRPENVLNDLNRLNVLNGFPDLSVRDHLAESAAELADRSLMNEIRVIVERRRLPVDNCEQRAIAFRDHGKRCRRLHLQR